MKAAQIKCASGRKKGRKKAEGGGQVLGRWHFVQH